MGDQVRNSVLFIDGIRYSVSMAEIAAQRLRATLDDVAMRHAAAQQVEEQVVSALLDAWAVIDMCHRARVLVQKLSQKLPGFQIFLRSTSHVERLRHYVQHFDTKIPKIPSSWTPLWGALCWVPTHEPGTCYTIFTGNLLGGLQAPTIAYDRHELRFASQIVLYAGTDQADLPGIATQMQKLGCCLVEWIEKHPKFTRGDRDTDFHIFGLTSIGRNPVTMTIIEITPHRWGWKAFEAPGVEPVFPKKDQAIDYAQNRACFRSGEIRILDATGNVERTIAFSEADRKL